MKLGIELSWYDQNESIARIVDIGGSEMRNCIVTLLLWGLFVFCGMAAAQEPPALTPKNPISLTKVEGRMDHLGVDVKGRRLFATAFADRKSVV